MSAAAGDGAATEDEVGIDRGWESTADAVRLVFSARLLRRTLVIALVVGTLLTLINQGHVIAGGEATSATWARMGANYLIPFVVSSIGALSATHT